MVELSSINNQFQTNKQTNKNKASQKNPEGYIDLGLKNSFCKKSNTAFILVIPFLRILFCSFCCCCRYYYSTLPFFSSFLAVWTDSSFLVQVSHSVVAGKLRAQDSVEVLSLGLSAVRLLRDPGHTLVSRHLLLLRFLLGETHLKRRGCNKYHFFTECFSKCGSVLLDLLFRKRSLFQVSFSGPRLTQFSTFLNCFSQRSDLTFQSHKLGSSRFYN